MKIKNYWNQQGWLKFDLKCEIQKILKHQLTGGIEKQWNQIFFYRFITKTLNLWYENKKPKEKCLICKEAEENMVHIFKECKIIQFTREHEFNQNNNWWEHHLEQVLLIKKNLILNDSIQKQIGKKAGVSVQDKLEIQKKCYALVRKTQLSVIWKNRCQTIFENEEPMSGKALWLKIIKQMRKEIMKFKLIQLCNDIKQYVEQVFTSILTSNNQIVNNNIQKEEKLEVYILFDGGARNNPGPGGSGSVCVILKKIEQEYLLISMEMVSAYINNSTTNNVAEYLGLFISLKLLKNYNHEITIIGDSQLVLNQIKNLEVSRNINLNIIQEEIYFNLQFMGKTKFQHHYREKNKLADRLSNIAMDEGNIIKYTLTKDKSADLLEKAEMSNFIILLENDLNIKIISREKTLKREQKNFTQNKTIEEYMHLIKNIIV